MSLVLRNLSFLKSRKDIYTQCFFHMCVIVAVGRPYLKIVKKNKKNPQIHACGNIFFLVFVRAILRAPLGIWRMLLLLASEEKRKKNAAQGRSLKLQTVRLSAYPFLVGSIAREGLCCTRTQTCHQAVNELDIFFFCVQVQV